MAENLRIPIAMREQADQVIAVTDDVCTEHLDAEYARLARSLVARWLASAPRP